MNGSTMWKRVFAAAIIGIFLGLATGCAQGTRMSDDRHGKPLQDSRADLSGPGPEHRLLDQLTGSWKVLVRYPGPAGERSEGRSSCEAQWTMDGRFVRLEYASTFAGRPFSVLRYVGFDRWNGEVVEVQFESTRTDVLVCRGRFSDDGSATSTAGKHFDPLVGAVVPVHSTTTWHTDGSWTLELTYGERTEANAITLEHRRAEVSGSRGSRSSRVLGNSIETVRTCPLALEARTGEWTSLD